MPEPFRLKVLKNLTDLLEGITPANGYEHDLAAAVFRGRLKYGPKDPIPMISILEAPIPQEPNVARGENVGSTGPWEILIQGFVDDDHNNPTDPAHILMAEVKKRLAENKREDRGHNMLGMGGRVTDMHIGQGSVRPPDEVNDRAFFWLTLTLRVAEELDKPYS